MVQVAIDLHYKNWNENIGLYEIEHYTIHTQWHLFNPFFKIPLLMKQQWRAIFRKRIATDWEWKSGPVTGGLEFETFTSQSHNFRQRIYEVKFRSTEKASRMRRFLLFGEMRKRGASTTCDSRYAKTRVVTAWKMVGITQMYRQTTRERSFNKTSL